MKYFPLCCTLFAALQGRAQTHESDWDAYVVSMKGRPVSIVVDLGLAAKAPMKERPYAVVVRTSLKSPRADGQPAEAEAARLDTLEEELVRSLSKATGALYAGRFTQRGLREFCFFTLDTVGYAEALHRAFRQFEGYEWLGKAIEDKPWSNYFDMLYPSAEQLDRMRYRRQSDRLLQERDMPHRPRIVEHSFHFKTRTSREQFLRLPGMGAFSISEIPELPEEGEDLPFALRIRAQGIPDYAYIEQTIMPLRMKAIGLKGRYDGWAGDLLR